MTEGAKIDLFGFEELNQFFETMKRTDQRRMVIDSFRFGSKQLITTAKAYIKSSIKTKSKGHLYKSIGFVPLRSGRTSVFVSAKVGARRFGIYKGYHGHLFDAGTTHRSTSSGVSRGKMLPNRFFTNALDQNMDNLINSSQDNMILALNKMIQRNLKKQAKAQTI